MSIPAPLKLAEHLGVSSATASATVDRLVQRKLIERSEHPHERRFVELKLSKLGTVHFQELHQYAAAVSLPAHLRRCRKRRS